MATGIRISCPACQQQMTVPESVRGKKVRCKNCEGAIQVPAAAAGPDQRITTAKAKQAAKPDDDENYSKDPYGVTETNLAPRCPHCAYELDPPDAAVCLHCGYHMIRRQRVASVKTYDRTAGDWFLWLLPGILCIILAGVMIGYCVFHHMYMPEYLLETKDVQEIQRYRINPFSDYAKWNDAMALIFYWPIQMWLFLILGYASFRALKFAFKRLVLNYLPPERIKER